MEIRNVDAMTMNELEDSRKTLYEKVKALPGRLALNGYEFVWEEKQNFRGGGFNKSLQICSTNHRDIDVSYEIGTDGEVLYYSFYSTSGNNTEEADKSWRYLKTCAELLSDNFRKLALADYNAKLDVLNSLKTEYEIISGEMQLRHDEAKTKEKAAEEKATQERRDMVEAVGQIWYDYRRGSNARYIVKDVTEKTILFNIASFRDGEWRIFDTVRIKKICLEKNIKAIATAQMSQFVL